MPTAITTALAGNLPAEVTRFIGRQRELTEARQVLERSRLVTLYGTGGVGKTRLALRLATEMQRALPDGAWLVELSALRSPELLARAVADALRLPDQAAVDPLDQLADRVAPRTMLLILDTCEHLVDACAMLAEVLLRAAPGLRILATSREPLDVMGEYTLQVPPLATPDAGVGEHADSVLLFADRAEAIVPGFVLTPENAEAVARLCHRLDGIPLAIELAAVRLRALSVEQIVTRLDDRFRLLGTARSRPDRHSTLRGAVEWSYDLCTPAEQSLWARLSVFPGGFDLEAAEAVGASADLPAGEIFDVLTRLIEKSVLLCDQETGRFRMLDTIREYGAERIGDQADLRRRHRDYYLGLAEQGAAAAMTTGQPEWLARLHTENANLRAALDYSLAQEGEEPLGVRMAVALSSFWLPRGEFNEARGWLSRALATGVLGLDRGWALQSAGMLAVGQGDLEAACVLMDEAMEIAEQFDDDDLRAHVIACRGQAALYRSDLEGAKAGHEAAQQIFDEIGYSTPFALVSGALVGAVYVFAGDTETALGCADKGLQACEATGEQWAYSFYLFLRAAGNWLLGEVDAALSINREALRIKERLSDLFGITLCCDVFAACAVSVGEYERAAALAGATNELWYRLGVPVQLGPYYQEIRAGIETSLQDLLGAEQWQAARACGASMPLDRTIALALTTGSGDDSGRITEPPAASSAVPLTKREMEIAELVAQGLSNREIAEQLIIAKRTADSHIEHILAKLGFSSRAQIAAWTTGR